MPIEYLRIANYFGLLWICVSEKVNNTCKTKLFYTMLQDNVFETDSNLLIEHSS